jgi:hypothetical protein
MRFRSSVLLFCIVVFLLTLIGRTIAYAGQPILRFWAVFAYMIVLPCVYALLVHPLLTGERRLSVKKIVLLTFSVTITAATVTHSVWTILTPQWAFSVTTDQSTYRLGEEVQITACLKNEGFITHAFVSALSDPVLIDIEYQYDEAPTRFVQVWFSSFRWKTTEFSIDPHHSLERTFRWNQTSIATWFSNQTYMEGKYRIYASVWDAETDTINPFGSDTLFAASTSINVTAS